MRPNVANYVAISMSELRNLKCYEYAPILGIPSTYEQYNK